MLGKDWLGTKLGQMPEHLLFISAQCTSVPVRAGDILVAATDGVWDNVFVPDCAALVASASHQGSPAQAAESLARHAHSR